MTKRWMGLALLALIAILCAGHATAAGLPACGPTMAGAVSFTTASSCVDADKTFSGMTIVSSPAANCTGSGCTTSTNSNTYQWTTGTLGTGATPGFAGTITANFDGGPTGNNAWRISGGGSATDPVVDSATLTYLLQSNVGAPAGPGLSWEIGGNVALAANGSITTGSNSPPPPPAAIQTITVTETFCINATTVSGCAAANLGTLEGIETITQPQTGDPTVTSFTFENCSAGANVGTCTGGATGSAIALSGFTTQIAVSDAFLLSRESNENAVLTLNTFANSFDEYAEGAATPEPATFGLLGAALLGLGALRLRKR